MDKELETELRIQAIVSASTLEDYGRVTDFIVNAEAIFQFLKGDD